MWRSLKLKILSWYTKLLLCSTSLKKMDATHLTSSQLVITLSLLDICLVISFLFQNDQYLAENDFSKTVFSGKAIKGLQKHFCKILVYQHQSQLAIYMNTHIKDNFDTTKNHKSFYGRLKSHRFSTFFLFSHSWNTRRELIFPQKILQSFFMFMV